MAAAFTVLLQLLVIVVLSVHHARSESATTPPTAASQHRCVYQPNIVLNSSSGYITSPNYPRNYNNSLTYVWRIYAPSPYVVGLEFTDFSLEKCSSCSYCDTVSLFDDDCEDASPAAAVVCGSKPPRGEYISDGRYATVVFKSDDSSYAAKGFRAYYRRRDCDSRIQTKCKINGVPHCCKKGGSYCTDGGVAKRNYCPLPQGRLRGKYCCFTGSGQPSCCSVKPSSPGQPKCVFQANTILNATSGYFHSPNYPSNYGNSMTHVWRIYAPSPYVVSVKFLNFALEKCRNCSRCDTVRVLDNDCDISNPSGVLFCGSNPPTNGEYISSGRYITVVFKSDNLYTAKGFQVYYKRRDCDFSIQTKCKINGGVPHCCTKGGSYCTDGGVAKRNYCPRPHDGIVNKYCCVTGSGEPSCCPANTTAGTSRRCGKMLNLDVNFTQCSLIFVCIVVVIALLLVYFLFCGMSRCLQVHPQDKLFCVCKNTARA